jgi:hypothetical protein
MSCNLLFFFFQSPFERLATRKPIKPIFCCANCDMKRVGAMIQMGISGDIYCLLPDIYLTRA